MLVTIVVLFVVTELPQGALALCSGLVEHCFRSYYAPLGDTMDIVALVNNGINFALYCTMSARFRQTFVGLLSTSGRPAGETPALRGGRLPADHPQRGRGMLRWRRRGPGRPVRGGGGGPEDLEAARPTSDALATYNVTPPTDQEEPNQLELVQMKVSLDRID